MNLYSKLPEVELGQGVQRAPTGLPGPHVDRAADGVPQQRSAEGGGSPVYSRRLFTYPRERGRIAAHSGGGPRAQRGDPSRALQATSHPVGTRVVKS